MNDFVYFWLHSTLATTIIAWFAAQFLKVVIVLIKHKKFDVSRFIGSGGMPSSHTSTVTALATAIAFCDGTRSSTFAISVILALIVMYDAAGVRRAAGQQAKIINKIIEDWGKASFSDTEKKLKELLGHTPKEVFAGAVLGIAIGIIRHI